MSRNLKNRCVVASATVTPQLAMAGLPQAPAPSRGEGSNILQTIQNWGYDAFMLIGLILLGMMLVGVVSHTLDVSRRIRDGKNTWADLWAAAAAGVGILGTATYLLTKISAPLF